MSDPYVGEVRLFAGNFAPLNWAFCQGQLLPIAEFDTLFNLIGTTYGGDGVSTFALPDLRGRVPIHSGQGPGLSPRTLGSQGGSEAVTLGAQHMPAHSHVLNASKTAGTAPPTNGVLAATSVNAYDNSQAATNMAPGALGVQGGSQPHNNMAPYVAVSYIISLFGIFPTQS